MCWDDPETKITTKAVIVFMKIKNITISTANDNIIKQCSMADHTISLNDKDLVFGMLELLH